MFSIDNTEGFTQVDIDLMNAAVKAVMSETGMDEQNACDIVNNNWSDGENTIDSLTRRNAATSN